MSHATMAWQSESRASTTRILSFRNFRQIHRFLLGFLCPTAAGCILFHRGFGRAAKVQPVSKRLACPSPCHSKDHV